MSGDTFAQGVCDVDGNTKRLTRRRPLTDLTTLTETATDPNIW